MGSDNLKSNMRIVLTDTCTVNLITVREDSIATSGLGVAWVGRFKDKYFGTISAISYLPFSLPAYNVVASPVFDSLSLTIKCYSDYYGDTLSPQKIYVYKLNKKIELYNDGHLYNSSSVPIDYSTSIATIIIKPKPSLKKTIETRLPDEMGNDLLDKFMNQSTEVSNIDNFSNYFKGFALIPDNTDSSLISSFLTKDSSVCISLYYHYFNPDKINESIIFPINSSLQFNQIIQNSQGTLLEKLSIKNKEINSTSTDNQAFIQGITGIHTNIEFPYLHTFKLLGEYVTIIGAQLYIKPVKGSYNDKTLLPDSITLNVLNEANDQLGSANILLIKDNINYNENTRYELDITSFIKDQSGAFGIDKKIMSLNLPLTKKKNPLRRLVFGDSQNLKNQLKVELKLMIYNGD